MREDGSVRWLTGVVSHWSADRAVGTIVRTLPARPGTRAQIEHFTFTPTRRRCKQDKWKGLIVRFLFAGLNSAGNWRAKDVCPLTPAEAEDLPDVETRRARDLMDSPADHAELPTPRVQGPAEQANHFRKLRTRFASLSATEKLAKIRDFEHLIGSTTETVSGLRSEDFDRMRPLIVKVCAALAPPFLNSTGANSQGAAVVAHSESQSRLRRFIRKSFSSQSLLSSGDGSVPVPLRSAAAHVWQMMQAFELRTGHDLLHSLGASSWENLKRTLKGLKPENWALALPVEAPSIPRPTVTTNAGRLCNGFLPTEKVQQMPQVQRREESVVLHCNTCGKEITSNWFLVRNGKARVLRPNEGHEVGDRGYICGHYRPRDGEPTAMLRSMRKGAMGDQSGYGLDGFEDEDVRGMDRLELRLRSEQKASKRSLAMPQKSSLVPHASSSAPQVPSPMPTSRMGAFECPMDTLPAAKDVARAALEQAITACEESLEGQAQGTGAASSSHTFRDPRPTKRARIDDQFNVGVAMSPLPKTKAVSPPAEPSPHVAARGPNPASPGFEFQVLCTASPLFEEPTSGPVEGATNGRDQSSTNAVSPVASASKMEPSASSAVSASDAMVQRAAFLVGRLEGRTLPGQGLMMAGSADNTS